MLRTKHLGDESQYISMEDLLKYIGERVQEYDNEIEDWGEELDDWSQGNYEAYSHIHALILQSKK